MRKNVKEFFSAFSKTTSSKNMLRIFQSLMVLQVFFAEHSLFRLVSSLTRQELTKKEQCYYLYVVKQLIPDLQSWRPAIQRYFPQWRVYSSIYTQKICLKKYTILTHPKVD